MKRIILNIEEGKPKKEPLSVEDAVECALKVIKVGEISLTANGPQYCFHTVCMGDVHVSVSKRKSGTQTFNIYVANSGVRCHSDDSTKTTTI